MAEPTLTLICTGTCGTCRKAVALLEGAGARFVYREYTTDPLDEDEIRAVLGKLGKTARDVLRPADAARAGLVGDEPEDALIRHMAAEPRLLQRPIGVLGDRAILGRPPEDLLALLEP